MSKLLPLLKYGPWSPSKASLASTCALAFHYRYVDHVPGGPKGTPAKVGVAVHRAQELILGDARVEDGIAQALAENEAELTHAEREQVKTFAHAMKEFFERIEKFKKNYDVEAVLLEQKWAITPDFASTDFFDEQGMMRGIVDFGLVLKNGYVIIIDHKTGRVRPAEYYQTQLHIYTLMALARYPDLKGVQCALHYVAHSRLEWSDPVKPKYIKDVLQPWLLDYLNKRADRVIEPNASVGKHCNWCDFRQGCTVRGQQNVEAGEDG